VTVQPDEVSAGWVTPVVDPGVVVGANFEGEYQFFLTSRGYLRGVGLGKFGRVHAPGALLRRWWKIEGHWRRPGAEWVTGLSLARAIYGPAGHNYPYEEIP